MGLFDGLRDFQRDLNFSVHGVAATVQPPHEPAVATTVIWLPTEALDAPVGADLQRVTEYRVLALRRDQVPKAPRGTTVEAPESPGESNKRWIVDGYVRLEAGHHRVTVIRDPQDVDI